MTAFLDIMEAFRFLRPLWLLGIPATFVLWWLVRRQLVADPPWTTQIAPHLIRHLTVNRRNARRLLPIDLSAICLVLISLATAGPAWEPVPNPFVSETAPLVIALEVSDTMLASDIQPTRLERAKMKILDLIDTRAGARTGLIAYAGSAHMVLPLTDDPGIIEPFLEGLAPDIMPVPGNKAGQAVELAAGLLEGEETPGSILLVTDGVADADIDVIKTYDTAAGAAGIVALILATEDSGPIVDADGGMVTDAGGARLTADLDRDGLGRLSKAGVDVVEVQLGDGDVRAVANRVASNLRSALDDSDGVMYRDEGWLVAWPIAFLVLIWFRKGWTMRWAIVLIAGLPLITPQVSFAQSGSVSSQAEVDDQELAGNWFLDLWLTPDQQGRLAYDDKDYVRAAYLFEDPMWKGLANYRVGRYADAAAAFSRVPTADGLFNMGNALIKAREYKEAVAAFEQALIEDPDHQEARDNLVVAQDLVAYLNRIREQSGTGDQQELGADDYTFDLEAGEGEKFVMTQADQLRLESADQWMRIVDTRPADFLRSKFALEAAIRASEGSGP